jgi:hypothetical protein
MSAQRASGARPRRDFLGARVDRLRGACRSSDMGYPEPTVDLEHKRREYHAAQKG